ncbi:uncharacterized protein A1O5_12198 [Cladophialophora psammophila CBS 110553]|uniref:MalT-like TPR region domain-containing protein n=1 Tax=Cladophialophora psammophila CBS 110553 TaxID=1182543 RepID=W9VUA2_9EURO|nr:uncharacterized protein A1O5_12198 [Cladophialophora psammophila CBS 110553]EXJ59317.1 hypothetical protein A1O5_12198 [Cladophialophora psammophila CBS 110553]
MTSAEAVELFFSRSGLGPESVCPDDLEKLLGGYLQYLALAITQAACYISERKKLNVSVPDYLKLLGGGPQHSEATVMDTLSKEFEAHGRYRKRKFQRHPVAFTFYISLLQIKNSNKRAVKLLSIMATVDRSQILRDLLLEDSILENYHLVTSEDGRVFNMHPLMHLGMRKLLTDGKLDKVADSLLLKLSGKFPTPEDEKPDIGDIYASHAKGVIDHDFEWRFLEVKLNLCHSIAKAEETHLKVLRIREAKYGESHRDTLKSVTSLAMACECQGNFLEAERLIRRALDGRKSLLGEDHPDTLSGVETLSLVFGELERFDEAEALCCQTLEG